MIAVFIDDFRKRFFFYHDYKVIDSTVSLMYAIESSNSHN